MSVRLGPLLLVLVTCATPRPAPVALTPVSPTPARSTADSIVAAVLQWVVVHGLPDFQAARTVVIQDDSGYVSSSSLPRVDSIAFVLLNGSQIQPLADRLGRVNVLSVGRPVVADDTAQSGASNRWVLRRERIGRMASLSACTFRLRRVTAEWQVDSTLGCLIS